MIFSDFRDEDRRAIFNEAERKKHIVASAIEKDWWVTIVLRALFSSEYASHMVFKGGTSLSKGWHLIERFSEDIDIAIDRDFLGYGGELSKNQISDRLRRASCSFVRENLSKAIEQQLIVFGLPEEAFHVTVYPSSISTVDPEKIYVEYKSVYKENNGYTPSRVLVEAGARSLMTPFEILPIESLVGELFSSEKFDDKAFHIPVTDASRTFLEKAFLLHEEFHKQVMEIRNDRMSRHLYDLEKMMDTEIAQRAFRNEAMYIDVVEHRRRFIGLKGFEYDTLYPQFLNFIPPDSVRSTWERDYRVMRESIIYGDSLNFPMLLERIGELNRRFRLLDISKSKY
ncbi:MAG: nucleotidyl transferase AbiEii/AbiGii toxin family protein [Sphaerochaetaceae bacterium]